MDAHILEGEEILADDYPVYKDYIYLCDEKPIMSNINGNVADLKQYLRSVCKLEARNIRLYGFFSLMMSRKNKKFQKEIMELIIGNALMSIPVVIVLIGLFTF